MMIRELDSMTHMGSFQLEIFDDSMVFPIGNDHVQKVRPWK